MAGKTHSLRMGSTSLLLLACALSTWTPPAQSQVFRCNGAYQDRPCTDQQVQQRYSAGRFDVDQVNQDTDKDCARKAAELMPFWARLQEGETLDAVLADPERRRLGAAERSALRDQLIPLKGIQGPAVQARGRLEGMCMADKRRKGVPTEREIEQARMDAQSRGYAPYVPYAPSPSYPSTNYARERAAAERAAAAARRAAAAAAR